MNNSADRVASVLANLPNDLEPVALLATFDALITKGGMDNDTLGHAYYTVYYGHVKPSISPLALPIMSLVAMYAHAHAQKQKPKPKSLRVVEQTDSAVYASSVCDAVLQHDGVIPPHVFCQAIRNVHPHELKNDYYHRAEICGYPFDTYLGMVNARLQEYFSDNRRLDDVLSGIKKCLCLRMLSNNMYYYRDNPADLAGLDPAIAKLMQFYTLTDFLHESTREVFDSHAHMIGKYNALKMFIDKVLGLGPSFMSTHYFIFGEITQKLELGLFDRLYDEPAYFPCADFPQCITKLKRNISADDILFSTQLRNHSLNHKQIVDNGLMLLQFFENRIKQDNALALNTTDDDDVAHEVFQMTGQAIQHLPLPLYTHEHTLFAKFDKELFDKIRMISIPLSKKKKVLPLPLPIRIHSVPFQALIISPRMFRAARNIPYRSGSVSVHRPGSVQRMSPPPSGSVRSVSPLPSVSVHRASPLPPSSPRSRKRKREERGGARTKSKRSKRSKRSKKVLIRK